MMVSKVIIAQEAEVDLVEAYRWYEVRKSGLGEEYLQCVEECIQLISFAPESFEKVYKNFRRAIVKRFPYLIFYEFSEDTVVVYGNLS